MSQGLGSGASLGDLLIAQGLGSGVAHSERRSQAEVQWASLTEEERQARVKLRREVDARGELPVPFPLLEKQSLAVVRPGPDVAAEAERWASAEDMKEYLLRPGSFTALQDSGIDLVSRWKDLRNTGWAGRSRREAVSPAAVAAQPAAAAARSQQPQLSASVEASNKAALPKQGLGYVKIPLGTFTGGRGAASSVPPFSPPHAGPVQPSLRLSSRPSFGLVTIPLGTFSGGCGAASGSAAPMGRLRQNAGDEQAEKVASETEYVE